MSPSPDPTSTATPELGSPVYFDAAASAPPTDEMDEETEYSDPPPADAEERGVRRAQIASLASVAGIGLVLVGPFVLVLVLGLSLPFLGHLFGTAALTLGLLEGLLGLIAVGALLQVGSFALYGSSFGLLQWVDHRFRAPRTLSMVGLGGFILIFAGVGGILALILVAVNCASGGGGTSCIDGSEVLALVIALLIGSVLAFVGWIGLLLGLYRYGSRYESPLLKASAILMIVPLGNLFAPLLAFIALRAVPRRFDLRASAAELAPPS